MIRCFMSSARAGSKRSFIVAALRLGGIVASGPNNFLSCGEEGLLFEKCVQMLRLQVVRLRPRMTGIAPSQLSFTTATRENAPLVPLPQ
jgi:hypothetical protein